MILIFILIEEKGDTDTDTFHIEKSILIRYFPAHEFQYWYDTDMILFSKSIGQLHPTTPLSDNSLIYEA